MRKFAAIVLLLSLFAVSTSSTVAQTRARRVGGNAPTPAPASSNVPSTTAPRTSGGGADAKANPRPTRPNPPAATRENDVEEEVEDDAVVRVNTSLVTIPVSVMDRDGKYIPNLYKEDFRIYEDGVEQELAYFATVEKPFTVALVIDTSNSTAFKLEEMQDAAIAFVNQLRADDRVLVVTFDDGVRVVSEATSDRNALRNAIRRTRRGGSTKLYDAVDFVIKNRLNRIDGRKAIVLFTDGVDTSSQRASYQSTVRDAEELDALIYPVHYDTYDRNADNGGSSWPPSRRSPTIRIGRFPFPLPIPLPGGGTIGGGGRGGGGGAGSSRSEHELGSRYLRELADKTGGRQYEAHDLRYLTQSFAAIAEELRRQYSLGYYPKMQSAQAGRRQIRVRVYRPNLVVRARDSYIYKPSGDTTAQDDTRQQQQQSAPPELRRRQFSTDRDGEIMRK
ncbi:MAG TPA: VWA domain-containing protein [Pyrinomonadaceae bacterium]|jgi:VWFA-related protein